MDNSKFIPPVDVPHSGPYAQGLIDAKSEDPSTPFRAMEVYKGDDQAAKDYADGFTNGAIDPFLAKTRENIMAMTPHRRVLVISEIMKIVTGAVMADRLLKLARSGDEAALMTVIDVIMSDDKD